jgi:hypothetical protein
VDDFWLINKMNQILMNLLILFVIFTKRTSKANDFKYEDIERNEYLFISGFPQSGTSLIHQILSLTPHVRTMVKKCNEIIGKKCLNWNHEGQWLLKASPDLHSSNTTFFTFYLLLLLIVLHSLFFPSYYYTGSPDHSISIATRRNVSSSSVSNHSKYESFYYQTMASILGCQ